MSNEQDTAKRIEALEQAVYELRHVVAVLANSTGNPEGLAAAVEASKRAEKAEHARANVERATKLNTP